MVLKAEVEWWKEGLDPKNAIEAWATAATTSIILSVLIDEKLARDGSIEVDGKTIVSLKDDGT